MDGKNNIADYIDPDIEAKLAMLEKEEVAAEAEADVMGDDMSDLDEEDEAAVEAIRERERSNSE